MPALRASLALGAMCLLISIPAGADDLATYGLPGLAWGQARSEIQGLSPKDGPSGCPPCPGAPQRLLGVDVAEVRCCFVYGTLSYVEVNLSAGGPAEEELIRTLSVHLGPPAPPDNALVLYEGGTAWLAETAVQLMPGTPRPTLMLRPWDDDDPMRAMFEAGAAMSRATKEYRALWKRHRDWKQVDPAFEAWMRRQPDTARLRYTLRADGGLELESPAAGQLSVDPPGPLPRRPEVVAPAAAGRKAAPGEDQAAHQELSALLEELRSLVATGLPQKRGASRSQFESRCRPSCFRELSAVIKQRTPLEHAEHSVAEEHRACMQRCQDELTAELDARCGENEKAARTFLEAQGTRMRELVQRLQLRPGDRIRGLRELYEQLSAIRRLCPAGVERLQARVVEVFASLQSPASPSPPTR